MTQLSLMHPTPPQKTAREQWMARLRKAIRERYRGQEITADEAVALMEARPELRRPHHVHPNSMGTLFSTWDRARPVMIGDREHRQQRMKMSMRDRNRLGIWEIT